MAMKLATLQKDKKRYQTACAKHPQKRLEARIAEDKRLIDSIQLSLVETKLAGFQLLTEKVKQLDPQSKIQRLEIQGVVKDYESQLFKQRSTLLNNQFELSQLKDASFLTSAPIQEVPSASPIDDEVNGLDIDNRLSPSIVRVTDIQTPEPSENLSFDETQLELAAESILRLKGTVNPLVLRREGHATNYSVIDGYFEYYAALKAKEMDAKRGHTINAYIIESDEQEQAYRAQLEVFRPHSIGAVAERVSSKETLPPELATSQETVASPAGASQETLPPSTKALEEPVTDEIKAKVSQQIERLEEKLKKTDDPKLKQEYENMLANLQETFQKRLAASENTATETTVSTTADNKVGLPSAGESLETETSQESTDEDPIEDDTPHSVLETETHGDVQGLEAESFETLEADSQLAEANAVADEFSNNTTSETDSEESDPYGDLESCDTCSKYEHTGCDDSGETYGHCTVLNQETYGMGLCAEHEFRESRNVPILQPYLTESQEGELLPKAPVTPDEKPAKSTTRECLEIDPDHDVAEKLRQYLNAEWDEKQKTEVALHNAIRHEFSTHWPDDSELLLGTVLELKATQKVCAAATLVEQQGDKPFLVYCLRYERDETGEIINTLKDHRTYKRASSAHNKVYKWVNEDKQ